MADVQQITSYRDRCLPLLLAQYKDSVRLRNWIGASLDQADDVEQDLFDIRQAHWLVNAEGVQLDTLGAVYGEERQGRTDADFRAAIGVRAAQPNSGTPDEICTILQTVFGVTSLEYMPEYPAKYMLGMPESEVSKVPDGAITSLSPAGVQGLIGEPIKDGAGNYVLDGRGQYVYSARKS